MSAKKAVALYLGGLFLLFAIGLISVIAVGGLSIASPTTDSDVRCRDCADVTLKKYRSGVLFDTDRVENDYYRNEDQRCTYAFDRKYYEVSEAQNYYRFADVSNDDACRLSTLNGSLCYSYDYNFANYVDNKFYTDDLRNGPFYTNPPIGDPACAAETAELYKYMIDNDLVEPVVITETEQVEVIKEVIKTETVFVCADSGKYVQKADDCTLSATPIELEEPSLWSRFVDWWSALWM